MPMNIPIVLTLHLNGEPFWGFMSDSALVKEYTSMCFILWNYFVTNVENSDPKGDDLLVGNQPI